jgi:GGDEF domain-containing protein
MIIHTHTSILSFFTANKFAVGTSSTVLSQVASVPFGEFLVNVELQRLVTIDGLTQVANRRRFE